MKQEILGTISGAAGLIDQSIRLVKRVHQAYKDAENLPNVLDNYTKKLELVQAIIHTVQDEPELQTATVTLQLNSMKEVISSINSCLKTMADNAGNRSTLQRSWHQLTHGKANEKTLTDYMTDLDDAKSNLSLVIQLAAVGLVASKDNTRVLIADTQAIERTNKALVEVFGEEGSLQLAKLIQDRHPQDNGQVIVGKDEIAALWDNVVSTKGLPQNTDASASNADRVERIIIANTALDRSKMINGPVGEDMWKSVTVKILNNHTAGTALMINWAITPDEANKLLDRQDQENDKDREERMKKQEMEFEKIRLEYQDRREQRDAEAGKRA
ncbi:hypothetical protein FPSE5266_20259 [Fusarium pseudograminearum]|nr:hypothetical protein FPSE5266_20259 [Fusarium pseudograminearum]